MADNVTADPGAAGAVFATDDIGPGVHYPRTKLSLGADGSATDAVGGTGTDSAAVQRVTLATDISLPTGPVTNAGTFVVQMDGDALTALQLIDDPVFADNAGFTLATSKVMVQGGVYQNGTPGTLADNDAGAILLNSTAGQMVELMASSASVGVVDLGATDNAVLDDIAAQVTTVAGAVSTQMQVDIVADGADLLTNTNFAAAYGTAGTADAQVMSVQGIASMTPVTVTATNLDCQSGGADMATAAGQLADGHNVTIDNGAAGAAVNIQDGGNTITVDGTVTANPASGTIDTVTTVTTANLAAETTKVIGTVRVASGGIASGSLASGSIASGAVASGAVASGAVATGAFASGSIATGAIVDLNPGNATSAATAFDSYGHVAINLTTAANQVLVSSAVSKQIWVYSYGFTCGDADGQTVSLQDEDDAALTGIMEFSQYGGISVPPSGNFHMPIFKLATNKDLEIDITGGDVDGFLTYAIVSV